MTQRRRTFSRAFKVEAVRQLEESGKSLAEVARGLGIHPNMLSRWRDSLARQGEEAFPGRGKLLGRRLDVRRLRRELARTREERDVLEVGAPLLRQQKQARFRFMHQHEERFTVRAMCAALEVSRSGYYRWRRQQKPD